MSLENSSILFYLATPGRVSNHQMSRVFDKSCIRYTLSSREHRADLGKPGYDQRHCTRDDEVALRHSCDSERGLSRSCRAGSHGGKIKIRNLEYTKACPIHCESKLGKCSQRRLVFTHATINILDPQSVKAGIMERRKEKKERLEAVLQHFLIPQDLLTMIKCDCSYCQNNNQVTGCGNITLPRGWIKRLSWRTLFWFLPTVLQMVSRVRNARQS